MGFQICMMRSKGKCPKIIPRLLDVCRRDTYRYRAHVSRDTGYERGHVSLLSGRDSDIRPASLPTDDTENTFMFTVPSREVLDSPLFNHAEESPSRDGSENHDWDQVVGIAPAELDAYGMPNDEEVDISLHNTIVQDINTSVNKTYQMARKKKIKVSKHGIQYPSLPVGVVKKLATTYARMSGNSRAKISKVSLDVIIQASDWFFEQVSDDLGAYAKHAGRKTIEESDVVTLMKRCVFHDQLR
jgi:histone H3/H4